MKQIAVSLEASPLWQLLQEVIASSSQVSVNQQQQYPNPSQRERRFELENARLRQQIQMLLDHLHKSYVFGLIHRHSCSEVMLGQPYHFHLRTRHLEAPSFNL